MFVGAPRQEDRVRHGDQGMLSKVMHRKRKSRQGDEELQQHENYDDDLYDNIYGPRKVKWSYQDSPLYQVDTQGTRSSK